MLTASNIHLWQAWQCKEDICFSRPRYSPLLTSQKIAIDKLYTHTSHESLKNSRQNTQTFLNTDRAGRWLVLNAALYSLNLPLLTPPPLQPPRTIETSVTSEGNATFGKTTTKKIGFYFFTYECCRRRLLLIKRDNAGEEVSILLFSAFGYEYLYECTVLRVWKVRLVIREKILFSLKAHDNQKRKKDGKPKISGSLTTKLNKRRLKTIVWTH